ncbi:hypothetical protein [Cognataquiflexum nitidum]|nr:hypothetical protein [Cognataquiflexum nitidum]
MSRLWPTAGRLVKISQKVEPVAIMDILVLESLKEGNTIHKK